MRYNIQGIFFLNPSYLDLGIMKVTKVFNYQAAPEEASKIFKGKPPAGSVSPQKKFACEK